MTYKEAIEAGYKIGRTSFERGYISRKTDKNEQELCYSGRGGNGAEMIDSNAVYINSIGKTIEWNKDDGGEFNVAIAPEPEKNVELPREKFRLLNGSPSEDDSGWPGVTKISVINPFINN